MAHRIIFIEHTEKLRLYLDNLKVENEQGDLLIPVSDIQMLIIDNYKTSLSVQLINKLIENNVCTILCGIDHLPQTQILPINGNFSQSGNIFKQILWNNEIKQKLQKLIVKGKISNQARILQKNKKSMDVVEKLYIFKEEVTEGDPGNREGLAAKIYFRELFGSDFARFDNDVCNAALNYGYAILRSSISSIIIAKGYIGNIGLFHRGKTNLFNLSDDIIEVFRPIIDDFVYNNFLEEIIFKQEHKEMLIKIITQRVYFDGKLQTITNIINDYIESILNVIESNDENDYVCPDVIVTYDI